MQATHPPDAVVLGIDSSTQSTKVIAWDRQGREVAQGRASIAMQQPRPGWFEQEPDDWWRSLCEALAQLWTRIDARRVIGMAISNQRETLAYLDAEGQSVRPAMVWLDERALAYLPRLSEQLGAQRIHQITGKPVDITPGLYRIAWMREQEPEAFARTRTFCDVQTLLALKLTGQRSNSWASADPCAVFDIHEHAWSTEIMDCLGLDASRFARSHKSGTPLGRVTAQASAATGLPEGMPLFAGGGDGQCAGVGVNCMAPGQAYVNLGTAIVSGVWSPTALIDRNWRTLVSASGSGYILETVQRTGAHLVNWFVETFTDRPGDLSVLTELEGPASQVPIGSDGLLVMPYWSGCMTPHWDSNARGCIIGFGHGHTRAHVYRAMLEGLTLETARAAQVMAASGVAMERVVAIGGGTRSALWLHMLADATGCPLCVSETAEASALGAGMIAAFGAGWYASINEAAAAMAAPLKAVAPDHQRQRRYAELMQIQGSLYAHNMQVFRDIENFKLKASLP